MSGCENSSVEQLRASNMALNSMNAMGNPLPLKGAGPSDVLPMKKNWTARQRQ
jgi:hypothetical protein